VFLSSAAVQRLYERAGGGERVTEYRDVSDPSHPPLAPELTSDKVRPITLAPADPRASHLQDCRPRVSDVLARPEEPTQDTPRCESRRRVDGYRLRACHVARWYDEVGRLNVDAAISLGASPVAGWVERPTHPPILRESGLRPRLPSRSGEPARPPGIGTSQAGGNGAKPRTNSAFEMTLGRSHG